MAVSSISCALKPPAPVKEASARQAQPSPPATNTPWSGGLRRACVAAAACVVIETAGGGGGGDVALARGGEAASSTPHDVVVAAVDAARPAPRWSDRRGCPPWRANSLENIVPENLPRPSARRSFNSIRAPERAPALAPEAAVAPFLTLHSGLGCFSL